MTASTSAAVILASASPRRHELLQQIGVEAIVQSVDIDETHRTGEAVLAFVQRLAIEKAKRGYDMIENPHDLPVIGSDTVVEVNGEILGKPENREHATKMLQKLSGKKHKVHTSVAIVNSSHELIEISSSEVEFMQLDPRQIEEYLLTGEADDKAGAYAIQGIAAQFVARLNGSFSGVMGLPLYETCQLLKKCGINTLTTAGR